MSYTSWHVGMKVVYIKADVISGGYGDEVCPVKGKVYTIRELSPMFNIIGCRLAEIVNSPRRYLIDSGRVVVHEPWFDCRNFRPVQTRKTDISIFRALLRTNKEREPA